MKTAALAALLPLLATVTPATARPRHHHSSHGVERRSRKSLNFGPAQPHKSFEVVDHSDQYTIASLSELPPREIASKWIEDKIGGKAGEAFYIREDSYTDKNTGVSHIYARQLLNGIEVSGGDININIDQYGRVISYGSSFIPSTIEDFAMTEQSGETEIQCANLRENLEMQQAELENAKGDTGAWGMVKAAAEAVFPGLVSARHPADEHTIKSIKKNIHNIQDHIDAICKDSFHAASLDGLDPVTALRTLLARITTVDNLAVHELDLTSIPEHTLVPKPAPAEPPTQYISGAGLAAAGVIADVPARVMYLLTSTGPRGVYRFEVQMKDNWYQADVDFISGELLSIVDWANSIEWDPKEARELKGGKGGKQHPLPNPSKHDPYTYNVFPWGINDPTTGNTSILTKPWDTVASPAGWHQIPRKDVPGGWNNIKGAKASENHTDFYTTVGNNLIAHEDWEGQNNYLNNYRPVNDSMVFVYDYEEPLGLAPKEYVDFVVTQLFYTSNMYHDLLYRLGFDEVSGNFQASNFGLGGRGGDPVICNAQDGSGYNNANFATPPDGNMPRMRMYVWDTATPFRDGDLEAGIVIHEYSHGLSTRLTGGPMDSGCLGWGESGGMGEGWGDNLATLIRQIEEHKNFENGTDVYPMGAWAANRLTGIRNFAYSTNETVNPSTYKTLDKPGYFGVHAIGEVWSQMLFVVAQELIKKHGFSKTLFPPTNTSEPNDYYTTTLEESVDALGKPKPLVPKHGNTLLAQLVVNGMKLQPCRPTFFDARNAIIQADQVLTGGENACIIWKAFASRGLGSDAKMIGAGPFGGIRTNGFNVPARICAHEKDE